MGEVLVAYFFEREDAEEVARQLPSDDVAVRRERFHGEDDDEDHPWTIVVPAGVDPELAEDLVTQYNGWLDAAGPGSRMGHHAAEVAPLPDAPRRFKNPPPA